MENERAEAQHARRRRPRQARTSPTRRWPRSPRSSASTARTSRAARAEADRLAAADRPRPRTAREQAVAGLAELEPRLAAAEEDGRRGGARHHRARAPRSRPPAPPARPRWRPGSRCAPPRSAPAPSHGRVDAAAQGRRAERSQPAPAPPSAGAPADRRGPGRTGGRHGGGVRPDPARGARSQQAAERPAEAVEDSRRGREQELMGVRHALRDLGKTSCEELVSSVHRDEMARAQQQMRIEQTRDQGRSSELGAGARRRHSVADYGPDQLGPVLELPARPRRRRGGRPGDAPSRAPSLRPRGAGQAAARTQSASWPCSGKRQPARAGGVRGDGGAPPVPHRAARGPHARPARTSSTSSRTSTTGSRRSSPRPSTTSPSRLRPGLRAALPGRSRAGSSSPTPTDMLTTGIEVEARPPGKKVKRLSLLSGGERSLVAVALPGRALQGPALARSTSSTRSRPRSTTPTSAACWRSTRSCARTPSSSSSPTRSARWRSATPSTASPCAVTASRP